MKIIGIALLTAVLVACGTVETVPVNKYDPSKTFSVAVGKANIYIVQVGGYFPGYNIVQVYLNGQALGALSARTFHVVSVNPGSYTVVGVSPENQDSVTIHAEADKNYFVGLRSRIGWNNMQVSVLALGAEEGKQSVLAANRAAGLLPQN